MPEKDFKEFLCVITELDSGISYTEYRRIDNYTIDQYNLSLNDLIKDSGYQHREGDGPTMKYSDGTTYYKKFSKLHRIDGPAVIKSNGDEQWWMYNKKHRIGGPAMIYPSKGIKEWWVGDQRHREDGPAVIIDDGNEIVFEWWLMGTQFAFIKYLSTISVEVAVKVKLEYEGLLNNE